MRKIDVFTHIWPKPFHEALIAHLGHTTDITRRSEAVPMMTDLDRRFEVMDLFGPEYCQILSLASPPYEKYANPAKSLELATIASDGMAELCHRYPDRFPGFIGTAVMSNPAAMVEDARRNIEDLGAVGMQIFTNVSGKPLDSPEFDPFFEYMNSIDKPIWMHPSRGANFTDYLTEEQSEYEIWWTFGWPYETSAAMARLVFSGLFDKYPRLKIITHHAGGMVPFFEGRVGPGWDQMGARTTDKDLKKVLKSLKRPHLEYFKEYYADTASFGSQKAIEHAIEFFGENRVLFASDAPFDPEGGPMYIRETIKILDRMDISDELRKKIYQDNAVELLGVEPMIAAHFIDGRIVAEGDVGESFNPADQTKLGDFYCGSAQLVDQAASRARAAFFELDWAYNPRLRAQVLMELAAQLELEKESIADLIVLENGKLRKEAIGETNAAISELRYYAGLARNIRGSTQEVLPGQLSLLHREPAGVAGIIVPWNAPLTLLARSLAPALAAGCTCIVKPALQTPLVHAKIMECIHKSPSLPKGAYTLS